MKWDVGLLSDKPEKSRSYQWMMRKNWFRPDFPEDVLEEIAIFWAMPGIDNPWLRKNFRLIANQVYAFQEKLPGYDQLKDKVIENWLSMTKEDCQRLSVLRMHGVSPPLASQLSIIDDLKAGVRQADIIRRYRVYPEIVKQLRDQGPGIVRVRWKVPPDFGRLFGIPEIPAKGQFFSPRVSERLKKEREKLGT